jgi:predicted TIM-barrel fold metal-dependent hydrolase
MKWSRRSLLALPVLGSAQSPPRRAGTSAALRGRLTREFDRTTLFDSHEHFWDEAERVSKPLDFFILSTDYVISDVISAGLPAEGMRLVRDTKAPEKERWRTFEPFWKHARFTGYSRALKLALWDIYGVETISERTLPQINEGLRARNRAGIHRSLMEKTRIGACVQDDYWHVEPTPAENNRYVLARRFDRFIVPGSPMDVQQLEKLTSSSITTLAGLEQALEKNFGDNLRIGMRCIKVGLAYMRDLHFTEAAKGDAERDFERLMKGEAVMPEGFRRGVDRPFRKLEDYMFHRVMSLALSHGLPVQVHTGINAGNRSWITNTNPLHLINTFFLYPRLRFDLFHIGYPYHSDVVALVKSFPNVHLDFTWAHVISPGAARATLRECLDTAPVNKIFGFGGDYHYPELSYAHARMARENIAEVLAEKVEERVCTESEALEIGKLVLHDNAAAFFAQTAERP